MTTRISALLAAASCIAASACSDDDAGQPLPTPEARFTLDRLEVTADLDLTYPDDPPEALVIRAHVAYQPGDLEVADPRREVRVSIAEAVLVAADGTRVAIATPGPFADDRSEVSFDSVVSTDAVPVATHELAGICGHGDVRLTLTVAVDDCADCRATAEAPVALTCRPDRRRPTELADRGDGPPERMPCASRSIGDDIDDGRDYGWRDGRLLFEDLLDGDGARVSRLYYRYDPDDRMVERLTLDAAGGELVTTRVYAYDEAGRMAGFEDVQADGGAPAEPPSHFVYKDDGSLGWSRWQGETEMERGYWNDRNWQASTKDALALSTYELGRALELAEWIELPSVVTTHRFMVMEKRVEAANFDATRAVTWSDDERIVGDVVTQALPTHRVVVTTTWDYDCE